MACIGCYEKQKEIDQLTEEVVRLKQKLGYRERKEKEGFFGSSTPSSKIPIKGNTSEENKKRNGGAKPGHIGHGRKSINAGDADHEEIVPVGLDICPKCQVRLEDKGYRDRGVVDSRQTKAETILYRLGCKQCPRCGRKYKAEAPGVLPKNLYGNQLLTNVAVAHYLHGIPVGRISAETGVMDGSLFEAMHQVAGLFASIPDKLMEEYRKSAVKHADETGWRNNGDGGYVWNFSTSELSLFLFRKTRSSQVPKEVFGDKSLPGVLVADRYNGYNKVPCAIQYCYAHLLREFEDLEKEFPDDKEVSTFTGEAIPLLTQAMKLRVQSITDKEFYVQAGEIKRRIIEVMERPAKQLGIRRLQDIFRENAHRLYLWVTDRRVPADNNFAERELRPTVIARKVSFGSQSDNGANTRSILMTVLHTLKKRTDEPAARFKEVLDALAKDSSLDPYPLLFPQSLPP